MVYWTQRQRWSRRCSLNCHSHLADEADSFRRCWRPGIRRVRSKWSLLRCEADGLAHLGETDHGEEVVISKEQSSRPDALRKYQSVSMDGGHKALPRAYRGTRRYATITMLAPYDAQSPSWTKKKRVAH